MTKSYTIDHPAPSKGTRIADYYPLSTEELAALLAAAREAACTAEHYGQRARAAERLAKRYHALARDKWGVVVDIQCRLAQSIPGTTCPEPARGRIAKRLAHLDEVYTTWHQTIARSREPLSAEMIRLFEELLTGSGNPGSRTTWLRRLGLTP